MFPPAKLDPNNTAWVNGVQNAIESAERTQPALERDLNNLQRESNSVLQQVSSRVNAYYTDTLQQYPVFERTLPMSEVLGGFTKVVSISAPAAADSTVAETWVSLFTNTLTLPFAVTAVGVRLNSAQFGLQGPSAYSLRFRWLVGTVPEGINTTAWMSRHQFNLTEYPMNPTTPILTNVGNRYAYRSAASFSTVSLALQASIQNPASRTSSVAAQNVTLHALNNDGNPAFQNVMVTV